MQVYKFIDGSGIPDGQTPVMIVCADASGKKFRCIVDAELVNGLKKLDMAGRMRAIKELLAMVEQSLLTYSVDCN
jgi:hypothetical protein